MEQIIRIDGNVVYIGTDNGGIIKTSIATVNYPYPKVGDYVNVFKNDEVTIVAKHTTDKETMFSEILCLNSEVRKIEKNLYVWAATFLGGYLGVDRFLRGQIVLGIVKLLTCGGLGVWSLIDFIIALTKAYGNDFGSETHVTFVRGEYCNCVESKPGSGL